jgi:glucosamine--fructose-6-phosphate aminotransferase (isomerizing)
MHDAIYAQPGALRLVERGNGEALAEAAARLAPMECVVLAGIGTSWHAALVGESLLARVGRRGYRARAFHSFELAQYWPSLDARTGVIVVSHRGSKRFSREVLGPAGQRGVSVLLTGKGSEPLAADITLRTVEQENSAAHTVSYTCALALLARIAADLGEDDEIRHELAEIPDRVALLLGQESWDDLATRFVEAGRYWFVGGGPNTATAYEAALKMSEANHATALGMHCEQFLHGPWAALDSRDVVFVIAPPGPSYERCLAAARGAHAVGAPIVAIVQDGDREIAKLAAETILIPPLPEPLSPILAVVPLQLFTYHTALRRGANPDVMRGDEPAHAHARAELSL